MEKIVIILALSVLVLHTAYGQCPATQCNLNGTCISMIGSTTNYCVDINGNCFNLTNQSDSTGQICKDTSYVCHNISRAYTGMCMTSDYMCRSPNKNINDQHYCRMSWSNATCYDVQATYPYKSDYCRDASPQSLCIPITGGTCTETISWSCSSGVNFPDYCTLNGFCHNITNDDNLCYYETPYSIYQVKVCSYNLGSRCRSSATACYYPGNNNATCDQCMSFTCLDSSGNCQDINNYSGDLAHDTQSSNFLCPAAGSQQCQSITNNQNCAQCPRFHCVSDYGYCTYMNDTLFKGKLQCAAADGSCVPATSTQCTFCPPRYCVNTQKTCINIDQDGEMLTALDGTCVPRSLMSLGNILECPKGYTAVQGSCIFGNITLNNTNTGGINSSSSKNGSSSNGSSSGSSNNTGGSGSTTSSSNGNSNTNSNGQNSTSSHSSSGQGSTKEGQSNNTTPTTAHQTINTPTTHANSNPVLAVSIAVIFVILTVTFY